jgi:hypothetical protein
LLHNHCRISLQNINTKTRIRTTTKLPDSIDPASIPRNIWYIPPNGSHGERFAVEIKGIPDQEDIIWKTSSSKKFTLQEKLNQAIAKRNEIYDKSPILKEFSRSTERAIELQTEFDAIISLACPDIVS